MKMRGGSLRYIWSFSKNESHTAVGIVGLIVYVNPSKNHIIAQIAAWTRASSIELTKGRQDFIDAVQRVIEWHIIASQKKTRMN